MKARSEERMRAVISAVLAFFLFLFLMSVMLGIGAAGLFSESHLRCSLENSAYTEQSYKELRSLLGKEEALHGLPSGLFVDAVNKETFARTLEENLKAALNGKDINGEKSAFEEAIKESINGYLKEKNVGTNAKVEEAVSEAAANGAEYINAYTTFPFGTFFAEYKESVLSFVKFLIPICAALAVGVIFLLLRMHESLKTGGSYALSAFLAVAFGSIIAGFILRFGIRYELSDSLAAYKSFIEAFFKTPGTVFWINGFCVGFIALIGLVMLKNFGNKRHSEVKK